MTPSSLHRVVFYQLRFTDALDIIATEPGPTDARLNQATSFLAETDFNVSWGQKSLKNRPQGNLSSLRGDQEHLKLLEAKFNFVEEQKKAKGSGCSTLRAPANQSRGRGFKSH